MAKTKTKTKTDAKFPDRPEDTKAISDGNAVAKARYYQTVQAMARSILSNFEDEYTSFDEAVDDIEDMITEEAEYAVPTVKEALEILTQSVHWNAGENRCKLSERHYDETLITMAIAAYEADLANAIEMHEHEYFKDKSESDDEL